MQLFHVLLILIRLETSTNLATLHTEADLLLLPARCAQTVKLHHGKRQSPNVNNINMPAADLISYD